MEEFGIKDYLWIVMQQSDSNSSNQYVEVNNMYYINSINKFKDGWIWFDCEG